MSSLLDETIRLAGREVTIIRTAGNITTYMQDNPLLGRRKLDPFMDYEIGAMFPSDSEIIPGDLIYDTVSYFLAMSVMQRQAWNEMQAFDAMLYKCNALVSIYKYDNTLIKSTVPCLITQVRAAEWDDDRVKLVKTYKGKRQPFQLFMQDGNGLTNTSYIVDGSSRRFRISKDFDMFIAEGIVQSQALWET